jgi:H+/gluconate symporter-like permease
MNENIKISILGFSVGLSVYIGIVLLIAYIYVVLYNYLFKKYRARLQQNKNLFDTSSSKETFISMIDVLLITLLLSTRVITINKSTKK